MDNKSVVSLAIESTSPSQATLMKTEPLVSIIINNYNYDRFLAEAINSALNQTYRKIEVIVVDDGSIDNSHKIIASYGSRIIPVLKSNAGQASSFNEGIKVSQGKIISFLDSDDLFHPDKVEKIVDFFIQKDLIDSSTIFFNSFKAINEKGLSVDDVTPSKVYSDWSKLAKIRGDHYVGGDHYFFNGEINKVCTPEQVYDFASKYRYIPYIGMPSSSTSMSHTLAHRVFPLPINSYRTCADNIMVKAASLLGSTYSTDLALTQYRLHGNNTWFGQKQTREIEEATCLMPDTYLNSKLEEIGRKPVLSFLKSMPACGFYSCYFGYNAANQLIKLAFDVVMFRLDIETCVFFVKTLTRGIYYKLRGCLKGVTASNIVSKIPLRPSFWGRHRE